MVQTRIRKFSVVALGGIRLVNGAAALVVPRFVAARLGVEGQPGVLYVLRLFGIRTVVLGVELLFLSGERLEQSIRVAPLIHASDTAAAAIGGIRGQLPRRAAVLTTLLSATNTGLALLAQPAKGAQPPHHSTAAAGPRPTLSTHRGKDGKRYDTAHNGSVTARDRAVD